MLKKFAFKPRFWPTVITIPALIILCILGNWQLDRLAWKLDLIGKLEERMGLAPVDLPKATEIERQDDWEYRPVHVSGHFLHMREMTMYRIGPNGRPGYDLFTPLLSEGGNYVLVNRGWVPEDLKQQHLRPETIPLGEVKLQGVLRKPWSRQRFAPENDIENNQWYFGDLEAMADHQDLNNIFPMFLYANAYDDPTKLPVGGRTRVDLVNNHLDYAMTWFGLAIVLVIIYLIFHIRRETPNPEIH